MACTATPESITPVDHVPAVASALKEIADATQRGNHFSGKDVAAGLAGGLLGLVIADGAIYLTRINGTTKVVLLKVFE